MMIRKSFAVIAGVCALYGCTGESNENQDESGEEVLDKAVVEINIEAKEVTYSADTVEMDGYLAFDQNQVGKRPGILVVHEWWGHNDYVRHRAEMLAELGYVALAVDMYGGGKQAKHPEDAQKFSGMVMKNMDEAKERFSAAYELLQNDPHVDPNKISAIGYCFGGSLILAMANSGMDLDGVAAFHSGVQVPVQPGDALQAKVLIQNGADDPFVTPESVEGFKTRMDEINKPYEYIEYPGAVHAYTNPGATEMGKKFELPLAYNEEADTKSWERLKSFLNELYPKQ